MSSRTVLDYGRFLRVEERAVETPRGQLIPNWPWVITPDFINVVAITETGQFILFRQDKYSIDGLSLAPVGGYLEPGEEPLHCAQRELHEETGYVAEEWTALADFPVDGNRGAGRAYFFLAERARRAGEPVVDDLEVQEPLLMKREEVEAALRMGEFKLLPWAAIIALALLRLSSG